MLHFHKWSQWAEEEPGTVKLEGLIVEYVFVQKRQCQKCGYIERKAQRIGIA